ncbi:LysR family transcriptional regulator [Labrys wisconsinensis]|uniref:DNA-binding transcriptional LysR family regulator n=1 Tax=Labrys wisconsinensis TaxID=425677 RepID=A0ABU0JKZ4_9HYPH|nr:LysR family transcriptional regulator [Labrys wisconsinensis]MDQ0474971.1 DNA-binding transcriptional LysR family regulator [Labrys wisconsinensis]
MTMILDRTAGLVAFVRTVEAGSFSGAGQALGSSPSAVSKSVARLERRLGVRLIRRTTRTLTPTAEGSAYFERVAPLLRAIDDAEDSVRGADRARGLLRVTAPTDLSRLLLAGWVEAFAARHPELKLEIGVADRHVDLVREAYDIAVRAGPLPDTGLTGRLLARLPFALVASPGYIARRGAPASIADLGHHACLRYLTAQGPYPWTWADGTSLVPDGPLDANDGGVLRLAALQDAGIVYLTRVALADDIAAGRLVPVLPDLALPAQPVYALHAFGRQVPIRARLFIDFLAERFAAATAG